MEKPSAASDLERFDEELGRMLRIHFPHEHRTRPRLWRPPTDVYETDSGVIVQVEVAGVDPDQIQISFQERLLSIRGQRPQPLGQRAFHCLEIPYGEFQTQVLMPGIFVIDQIQAKYENGFLYVTLPRERPKSIPVQIGKAGG